MGHINDKWLEFEKKLGDDISEKGKQKVRDIFFIGVAAMGEMFTKHKVAMTQEEKDAIEADIFTDVVIYMTETLINERPNKD